MKPRVLIVDDEKNMRRLLERVLGKDGCEVRSADGGAAALRILREEEFDLIVSDLVMPVISGLDLMKEAKARRPDVPFILITAHGTIGSAVEAMKAGAFDYLTKPAGRDEILRTVRKALQYAELHQEVRKLRAELKSRDKFHEIIGASREMESVFRLIDRVADSPATVLILGESGTGKELVARAIHRKNRQRSGPFVAVDCSVLTEHLLQSELFGHVKGAFTGALKDSKGLFQAANGGTIFLDEIGNISHTVQLNLLRVLQEREIKPVGSASTIKVDVRVLAATNVDLEKSIRDGKFRPDLFYRLSVVSVRLPPLRDRKSDIAPLAYYFMNKYAVAYGKQITDISPPALRSLMEYPWPGNVRELENVMERAVLLSSAAVIDEAALAFPSEWREHDIVAPVPNSRNRQGSITRNLRQQAQEGEKEILMAALRQARGNKTQAAKLLGISRSSIYNKIREFGLKEMPDF
jgi:DNA-binding NtrC family response regulator